MKKPAGLRADESEPNLVDVVAIEHLAKITAQYDLSEIEIDLGEVHVRVARQRTVAAAVPSAPSQSPAVVVTTPSAEIIAAAPAATPAEDLAGAVKSPMVGTAYLRPSPEAKPFVEIGATVKTGDKLMLVEAMKTFNDIVAHRPGRIANILVADGAPVEYGQTLMVIE